MRLMWACVFLCACGDDAGAPAPDAAPADAVTPDAAPYSTCPDDPRATPESLSQKAAAYDGRAVTLHASTAMPWVLDVQIAAGVDPRTATAADVVAWRSGENDGLWNGLYLASQAFRYAVTHDPAALANLRQFLG